MTLAYFDLENIFVNELVGDYWLFILIAFLLIWFICIKAKMPYQIPIMLSIILAGVGFVMRSEGILLWIGAVFIASALFYYMLSKIMNR